MAPFFAWGWLNCSHSRSRRSRRRGPRKPVNPAENQTANEPQETVAAPESPAAVDVLGVEE